MKDVNLSIDGIEVSFAAAKVFAEVAVSQLAEEFILIAWYDRQKGEGHPVVPECSHKPGWLAYAEGHGGNVRVDLNGGLFVFIFTALDALNDTSA